MSSGLQSGPDLLVRLLGDAEALARNGRRGDAFLVLRWASRIAPPEGLPFVLLSYQRIRLEGTVPRDRGLPTADGDARRAIQGPGIASDPLGFPVPRFPKRVPSVDASSFIPATPVGATQSDAYAGEARVARRRGWMSRALILCIGLAAVAGVLSPGTARRIVLVHAFGGSADPSEKAEAALRAGDPRRALSVGSVPEPSARLRLIRGQALLAIGDSAAAESELVRAAADARADAQVCSAAGEILGRMGRIEAAADAYLRAFGAGLPPDRWPAVVSALERAGRKDQAGRLREMLASAAPRGP